MSLKPVLMMVVFIAMLAYVIFFRRKKDVPVEKSVRPKREFWQVIILFGFIFVWESVINYLAFYTELSTGLLEWIKLISILLLLIIFAFVFDKKKAGDIGFKKPYHPSVWIVGISIFLIWTAAMWGKSNIAVGALLLMLFRDVFMEEVIFRGYSQTNLERSIGSNKGFWLAVIIFTAYHIPNIFWGWQAHYELGSLPEKFVRLGVVFLMSLFMCTVYRKTRSLYPLLAIHFLSNGHLANLFYLIF